MIFSENEFRLFIFNGDTSDTRHQLSSPRPLAWTVIKPDLRRQHLLYLALLTASDKMAMALDEPTRMVKRLPLSRTGLSSPIQGAVYSQILKIPKPDRTPKEALLDPWSAVVETIIALSL